MKKQKYRIEVSGCDDSTNFDVDLTNEEFELVKSICEKCTSTSTYGCQPVMSIQLFVPSQEEKTDDLSY